MGKFIDLTGQKFGRLTVIKRVENNKWGKAQWLCRCSCEQKTEKIILSNSLLSNRTQSCGCMHLESTATKGKRNKKYNTYDLSGDYGIGYTLKGEEFYFDLEDYDRIKNYCWYFDKRQYVVSMELNIHKGIKLHRLIMNENNPQNEIDHINGVKFDNRKENLRKCTHLENSQNQPLRKNNTSGFAGVYWDTNKKKWFSSIRADSKTLNLGYFVNKEDAIVARLKAELKYYGEFSPQKHLFEKYNIT